MTGELCAISSRRNEYALTESIPRENEGYLCSDSIEYEERKVGYALAFSPDTLTVDASAVAVKARK